MASSVPLWSQSGVFIAFVLAWISIDMLTTVALLPISMRLCDAKVAATQFTIYMAVANFGISFGAFVLGQSDAIGGFPGTFLVTGAVMLVGVTLLAVVKCPRRPEYYARQAEAALVFDTSEPIPKTAD